MEMSRTNDQKRKESPYMVMLRNNDRQKKESPYMVMLRNNDEKNTYISNKKQLQNHSLTFILKNQLASFSNQHSISFTHGLQHYRNLGQADVHRLCGLWQVSRQIWTIFLDQK